MTKSEQKELNYAYQHIGDKTKSGSFTAEAKRLQAQFHSSIEIAKKLRRN